MGKRPYRRRFEEIAFDATISDISIFQFLPKPSSSVEEADPTPPVVPVMITDPLLPRQYVMDWKSRHSVNYGSKASNWRYRPPQRKGPHTTSKDGPANQEPCLSLSFRRSAPTRSKKQPATDAKQQIELRIVPIHLFLDLHLAQLHGGLLSFVIPSARSPGSLLMILGSRVTPGCC
ncbi:hypothetical protein NMY22_g17181 [Coprinellus aureogranulatus]|nr:hypothetical protein NMY22_g17181 [Coprinellus aureogranulatus]